MGRTSSVAASASILLVVDPTMVATGEGLAAVAVDLEAEVAAADSVTEAVVVVAVEVAADSVIEAAVAVLEVAVAARASRGRRSRSKRNQPHSSPSLGAPFKNKVGFVGCRLRKVALLPRSVKLETGFRMEAAIHLRA